MAVVNLDESMFESTINGNGSALVDWRASGCGPWRMFGPVCSSSPSPAPCRRPVSRT
jgi:hypothetical protein